METICEGAQGVAVEDIQDRLTSLGYEIDQAERDEKRFGPSTANAVARFRTEHELPQGDTIDTDAWTTLVYECYQLGDRTLYLRLPYFRGNDVRQLQERLRVLGFSCGEVDGVYGPHTEAAVKLFQESVGTLADGMAFQDTFDAIERLRHVWGGKPADGPHPMGGVGYARAASVLADANLAITAEDPVSRNVAGRVWNLAMATSESCSVELVDTPDDVSDSAQALIIISYSSLPDNVAHGVGNVILNDPDTLAARLRTALQSSDTTPRVVRVEMPAERGAFTVSDAQTYAVLLLDALCSALDVTRQKGTRQ